VLINIHAVSPELITTSSMRDHLSNFEKTLVVEMAKPSLRAVTKKGLLGFNLVTKPRVVLNLGYANSPAI
jgi:hypothetical protein